MNNTVTQEFGLTKRKFNSAKAIITDLQSTAEVKEKKVIDLINSLIEGRQTNDFAHKNTVRYKFENFIEEQFEQQNLTYVKGIVDLNGRVQEKT
jgi:hypothetical protein